MGTLPLVFATVALLVGIAPANSDGIVSSPPLYPVGNNMTPEEYCPHLGSSFPPEPGCYPGGGANPSGFPKCCSKQQRGIGNCPNNKRPKCENDMSDAASYCADLRPNFDCFKEGWPQCCITDGTNCPLGVIPPCDVGSHNSSMPSFEPTASLVPSITPSIRPRIESRCILEPPYDAHQLCGEGNYCAIPNGVCRNEAIIVGTCKEIPQNQCHSAHKPVCGCDLKTYENSCDAEVAGVNVKKKGECKN